MKLKQYLRLPVFLLILGSASCCKLTERLNENGVCVSRFWWKNPQVTQLPAPSDDGISPLQLIGDIRNERGGANYLWEPHRFTWGQRTLFQNENSDSKKLGLEKFNQEAYEEAEAEFRKASRADRDNPELVIFYNNSKARQQENPPLTLAVVVPVYNKQSRAIEMLRGVAQAQDEFNRSGQGIDGRLLEIVIANDGNNKDGESFDVASQLISDPTILGVIGHNSSSATAAALPVYDQAKLAIISPTSTSTSLDNDVFFRTSHSDDAAEKKLAEHTWQQMNISKVVIFFDKDDDFSVSLKESFKSRFIALGGEIVEKDKNKPNFNVDSELYKSVEEDEMQAALLVAGKEVDLSIAEVNATRQVDKRIKLLGGDSLYGYEVLKDGGKNLYGLTLAIAWFIDAPCCIDFSKRAADRWNGDINWRSAMSYDATKAFLEAFTVDASRQKVLERLKKTSLSADETSGQELIFDADGERKQEPVLVEVVPEERRATGLPSGYRLVATTDD